MIFIASENVVNFDSNHPENHTKDRYRKGKGRERRTKEKTSNAHQFLK